MKQVLVLAAWGCPMNLSRFSLSSIAFTNQPTYRKSIFTQRYRKFLFQVDQYALITPVFLPVRFCYQVFPIRRPNWRQTEVLSWRTQLH